MKVCSLVERKYFPHEIANNNVCGLTKYMGHDLWRDILLLFFPRWIFSASRGQQAESHLVALYSREGRHHHGQYLKTQRLTSK